MKDVSEHLEHLTSDTRENIIEQQQPPSRLVIDIDRTTYTVSLHFSTTSKETMSDKIKRLIKLDINP